VEVRKVCSDARLEVRVDGELARAADLPAQDVPGQPSVLDPTHKLWVCEYNEALAIDVPPGRHQVQVENAMSNGSGIQVSGYRFLRPEPVSLRALGLTGRRSVLVWVQNRESLWQNWRQGTPAAVTGARLVIRGAPAGRLRAEWLDPWIGEWLPTHRTTPEAGTVVLGVPPVRRDLACRLTR
jgi:hypothetical protein